MKILQENNELSLFSQFVGFHFGINHFVKEYLLLFAKGNCVSFSTESLLSGSPLLTLARFRAISAELRKFKIRTQAEQPCSVCRKRRHLLSLLRALPKVDPAEKLQICNSADPSSDVCKNTSPALQKCTARRRKMHPY